MTAPTILPSILRRRFPRVSGPSEPALLFLLVALTVIGGVLSGVVKATWIPAGIVGLPVLAGSLFLGRRDVVVLLVVASATLGGIWLWRGGNVIRPAQFVLLLGIAVFALAFATTRDRLGVPGVRGESMLLELRERLRVQGEVPPLPDGWNIEVMLRSAGGSAFGGDFMVSSLSADGTRIELALVDVSGKGWDAGTRALLLSGALGGLLGSVPQEQFFAAANAYLLRQQWHEGFATSVHVAINLETGDYLLDCAGHPPSAQYKAGSGHWALSDAEGSVLGVLTDASWTAARGRLERGDALLLFTDGLIEVPGRDLALGIDKLLGEANRLVVSTFEGGAAKLIDAVAPKATDDRALALLWRAF